MVYDGGEQSIGIVNDEQWLVMPGQSSVVRVDAQRMTALPGPQDMRWHPCVAHRTAMSDFKLGGEQVLTVGRILRIIMVHHAHYSLCDAVVFTYVTQHRQNCAAKRFLGVRPATHVR